MRATRGKKRVMIFKTYACRVSSFHGLPLKSEYICGRLSCWAATLKPKKKFFFLLIFVFANQNEMPFNNWSINLSTITFLSIYIKCEWNFGTFIHFWCFYWKHRRKKVFFSSFSVWFAAKGRAHVQLIPKIGRRQQPTFLA